MRIVVARRLKFWSRHAPCRIAIIGEAGMVGQKPERVHVLGISGSAMAPVAGMLKERGFRVTGSDVNVYPPASTLLDSLGIRWKAGFCEENLQPAPHLCVIGNANSRGNPEVEYILDQKIPYCSMPQLLEDYFIPAHTSV